MEKNRKQIMTTLLSILNNVSDSRSPTHLLKNLFIENNSKTMEKNRKQIMTTFLSILDNISDKEYQKRIWIRGEGPEVDDFDETVCHFFQEGDGIIEEYKDFGLTEHQYKLLKKFRHQFEIFSDENDFPEEFINTPEWARIMDMAKDVLKAFNYQKNDWKNLEIT